VRTQVENAWHGENERQSIMTINTANQKVGATMKKREAKQYHYANTIQQASFHSVPFVCES